MFHRPGENWYMDTPYVGYTSPRLYATTDVTYFLEKLKLYIEKHNYSLLIKHYADIILEIPAVDKDRILNAIHKELAYRSEATYNSAYRYMFFVNSRHELTKEINYNTYRLGNLLRYQDWCRSHYQDVPSDMLQKRKQLIPEYDLLAKFHMKRCFDAYADWDEDDKQTYQDLLKRIEKAYKMAKIKGSLIEDFSVAEYYEQQLVQLKNQIEY